MRFRWRGSVEQQQQQAAEYIISFKCLFLDRLVLAFPVPERLEAVLRSPRWFRAMDGRWSPAAAERRRRPPTPKNRMGERREVD